MAHLTTRALLTMLAGGLLIAGCANDKPVGNITSYEKESDSAFQMSADRPPTPKTLLSMAQILAIQGKDAQCEYVLTRMIKDYPDFAPAYCEMAELRMRQGRVNDSINCLQRGLRVSPNSSTMINDLGMCYLMQGDNEKALAQFTRASGLAPQNARYRANMALALGLSGRYDESLALYQQVVPPAEAHYNLSVIAMNRKDHERSVEEYRRAAAEGFRGGRLPSSMPATQP